MLGRWYSAWNAHPAGVACGSQGGWLSRAQARTAALLPAHGRSLPTITLALVSTALIGFAALLGGCAIAGPSTEVAPTTQAAATDLAQRPAARHADKIKIALLLPASGPKEVQRVSSDLKQAAQLALFELDRPNVVVIEKDTQGTPDGARAAAAEAISDGARLIIGPLFSSSVSAAAQIARPAGVPILAFSNDRSVAGAGVHLLSFLPGGDIPRLVDHARMAGKQRMIAMVPKSSYGDRVATALERAAQANGVQLIAVERYLEDANAMAPAVKAASERMKRGEEVGAPIDSLFIAANRQTLPILATLLPYHDIDTRKVQVIGTGDWDFPGVARDEVLVGAWYAAPDPQGFNAFARRYADAYGQTPDRIASLAYDAVSLAVSLTHLPAEQRFAQQTITRASGFAGVSGLFRLTDNGVTERGLAIFEVQKFGGRSISAAPAVFSARQVSAYGTPDASSPQRAAARYATQSPYAN